MPGAHALTLCLNLRRSRAVHACGALRLVGGCTWRHNNVGGVTAGQAKHNSSNVGGVTLGQVGYNWAFRKIRYKQNMWRVYKHTG